MSGTKAAPTPSMKASPPVESVRRVGLSLGADLCWPLCYERILERWSPEFRHGGERVRIEVGRVPIEPFSLTSPCAWDVVLDRLTHWYPHRREWIKKAILMDDLYVLNNPWSLQSMEKHTSYAAMTRLGLPIPETWLIPPKSYEPVPDLRETLHAYGRLFDVGRVGESMGFPVFMKPYDGGGWKGVSHAANAAELRQRYESSGTSVMHVQKAVDGFDRFVRCIGIGPQVRMVRYDPDRPLHDRYTLDTTSLTADDEAVLRDMTLTINAFFGWDFNSCESLHLDGTWHPIDFANACPDSQVTSLHYHFPWLVLAKLKWSLFCAVTRRPMRRTLDWDPFFAVADTPNLTWRERLDGYAAIARERFDTDRFEAFCADELRDLDAIAWEFFASDDARDAIRRKVAALYPAHEVEPFTELFFRRVQAWRADNPPTDGGAA